MQKLVTVLRCDGIVTPFVFPGALNAQTLRVWITDVLIPELAPGDIVVTILRRPRAQSWDTLIEAISEALAAITPTDCLGWFKHV